MVWILRNATISNSKNNAGTSEAWQLFLADFLYLSDSSG
jgi:hypothetical protein